VIFPPETVLLDTSVLVHLIRGNPIGRWIDSNLLHSLAEAPLLSAVTVGETLALARRWDWGAQKVHRLEDLVRQYVVVDIGAKDVLSRYAEVDHVLRRMGNPIQQNDMWIAATAIASEAHLLTADRDFDLLHPHYLNRTWINPVDFL
jgi:tRNA(fMet)-specific endonuclease VapC